jgi:hypothetical protein
MMPPEANEGSKQRFCTLPLLCSQSVRNLILGGLLLHMGRWIEQWPLQ